MAASKMTTAPDRINTVMPTVGVITPGPGVVPIFKSVPFATFGVVAARVVELVDCSFTLGLFGIFGVVVAWVEELLYADEVRLLLLEDG